MFTFIVATLSVLISMPLILWLERNAIKHEDIDSQIQEWHNFRKALDKGAK